MQDRLFEFLGEKFSSENNLSDFTWAYANTSKDFLNLFMTFIFGNSFQPNDLVLEFSREYTKENKRVDFYIETEKSKYIIEVKIFDTNHHFEQYLKAFPEAEYGYITNYNLPNIQNVKTKTWSEFYAFLAKQQFIDDTLKNLISSYNKYLQTVCLITNQYKMNFKNLNSLQTLNKVIEKNLKSNTKISLVKPSRKPQNGIDEHRYGRYYDLTLTNGQTIKPWIGIFFNDDQIIILTEISEKYCKNQFLKASLTKENGLYTQDPYFDKDYIKSYTIWMNDEHFDTLNNSNNLNEQENLIKQYLMETIERYF